MQLRYVRLKTMCNPDPHTVYMFATITKHAAKISGNLGVFRFMLHTLPPNSTCTCPQLILAVVKRRWCIARALLTWTKKQPKEYCERCACNVQQRHLITFLQYFVKQGMMNKFWCVPLQHSVPFFWLMSCKTRTFTYKIEDVRRRSAALSLWVNHVQCF